MLPLPLTLCCNGSVYRLQDAAHLDVAKHVFPQQVVLLSAGLGNPAITSAGHAITKRQIAVRMQTSRKAQCIRRHLRPKSVTAADRKDGV